MSFSFEGTDAERTLAHRWLRYGWRRRRWSAGRLARQDGCGFRSHRRVFGHILQKRRGWHEEQVSGDGAAEVEYPVVVAGRPADEHVVEHLLDGAGRTAVADEIGAEFTLRRPAEGHVVAQD